MRIIIDAMGGDNAPAEIVRGAALAVAERSVDVTLVGREEEVRRCLAACGAAEEKRIRVVHAPDVIDMHDDPSTAVRRKPASSMAVALDLLKDGAGDAMISAGNTGALLTGATLRIRRIPGIRRAAFAPVLPNGGRGTLLIDCGANVECTPEYLLQFAFMGSFYARSVLGIPTPRVGLLSNGTEETKGTELCRAAYALLRAAGDAGRIQFIGNVEGSDALSGRTDVLVADGYTGNVLLKATEGAAKFLMKSLKAALTATPKAKLGALLVKGELTGLKKMMDPSEVGGTPFLGIRKCVVKAHGNSDAKAISGAVRQAVTFVRAGVTEDIARNIEYMKIHTSEGGEGNE